MHVIVDIDNMYTNIIKHMLCFVFAQPVIVFNGLETLKELLIKYGDVLSDRPHGNYFLDFDLQHKGILDVYFFKFTLVEMKLKLSRSLKQLFRRFSPS